MLKRLWILFAQATTVGLAALFVLSTLKPNWLPSGLLIGPYSGASSHLLTEESSGEAVTVVQSETPPPASALREAAAVAMPAVVYVNTSRAARRQAHPFLNDPALRKFFGDQMPPGRETESGLGSGVIVTTAGHILTNHHVIEDADRIQVTLSDGRKARARLVGSDPESDLAVLKIELSQLPVIRFGRPSALRVGDAVLAIGNPFGVGLTVTQGIVSALGRNEPELATFGDFIQTDAAINPGNSGGALVDANGALIGINTAILSRDGGSLGIGFAISADLAQRVMESLITKGRVSRGFLGVEPRDLDPELAERLKLNRVEGSLIAGVSPEGPADLAGLRVGDVVVALDDRQIRNRNELLAAVAAVKPGKQALLKIVREGQTQELKVVLAERPASRR